MPTDPMQPLVDTDSIIRDAISLLAENVDPFTQADRRTALNLVERARARMADYTPYRPEHARPEPVATEREWIGKVRGLIERNWITGAPARDLALQALDDARYDLAGQPVTVGARRALQSILDMSNEFAGAMQSATVQAVHDAAERGLRSMDEAGPLAPAVWSTTGDERRDLEQMRGEYHPAYGAGHDAGHQAGYDKGRESILSSVSYQAAQRAWCAAQADAELVDPYVPDPTIEVLPLPGDRFMLILSGWPDPWTTGPGESSETWRLAEQIGAAAVLAVSHPVFAPDGIRTGVNAAMLVADQHARTRGR